MTFLEKAMAEHSGIEESEIVRMMCPEDLGYVNSSHLCQGRGYEEAGFDRCWKCWNQEAGALSVTGTGAGDSSPKGGAEGEEGGADDGG